MLAKSESSSSVHLAQVFGYVGVAQYYAAAHSAQYLPHIRVPTLLLAATDDLFVWCAAASAGSLACLTALPSRFQYWVGRSYALGVHAG